MALKTPSSFLKVQKKKKNILLYKLLKEIYLTQG